MNFIKLFEEYTSSMNQGYKFADEETNKRIFRWFEICFYEANGKRFSRIGKEQYSLLSDETVNYLLATLDVVKNYDPKYLRLGRLLDPQTNQPLESDYQKIAHLTGNYFSGLGRGSILGTSLDIVKGLRLLMPPSQAVVDNIDNVFRELKFKYV